MPKQFGFGKEEKLKSHNRIDELFAKGRNFTVFPIRVSYQFLPADDKPVLQAGFTVGKKFFKKAVDRNRIKRLLREAYRFQKNELKEIIKMKNVQGYVFFMYTDKTILSFDVVRDAMTKCLARLKKINE